MARNEQSIVSEQTQAALAISIGPADVPTISPVEREVLRRLAGRVAELAARPEQAAKRDLWYRHNALEPTRPVIFCDPENGWNEIITPDDLACATPVARSWEMRLRKSIFWGESMGDDRVVEPVFELGYVHADSGWGMKEERHGGEQGGSYVWDAPLQDYERDFPKLQFPRIKVDQPATDRLVALARDTLGDLLEVRLVGRWWWTLGMTWTLVNLRGIEQVMIDMYDAPDDLKRLMAFLRDGTLAKLDDLESRGLLSLNNDGTYVGSGGFGYTRELPQSGFDPARVRTCDMWGFGESQETTLISPEMFAEFIFPYQKPILERFGLNCYGCCEPLHLRWQVVKDIPRLRRVSVSPWADLEKMAEYLGDRYVYSLKPNPADLAMERMDEQHARALLRQAMAITRGCRVEIIMKDNHTIGRNPQNVVRWCRIAREEAERAG